MRLVQRLACASAALLIFSAAPRAGEAQGVKGIASFATSRDGVRIAYEKFGAGQLVLVFVHGWSCDRSYWEGQLNTFAKDFTVVAIDLAGHGESGTGRKAYTIPAFGEDVAAVVTKEGLKNVILIGHSMGGDVVAEAAKRLPGRVTGIAWLDTYKELGKGRTPQQVNALVAKLRPKFVDSTKALVRGMFLPKSNRALVERVAADMSSAPPTVALSALGYAFGYSREMPATLKSLKLPVMAINPDNSPTDVRSMKANGVEVIVMTGVGHFLMMEDPDRFNDILRYAIDKLAKR